MKSKKASLADLASAKRNLRFAAVELRILDKGNPYNAVLVSAAVLDELLRERITEAIPQKNAKLIASFFGSQNGFAYSFAPKIDLAFALDVFGENAHKDFHTIRKIRNTIAHGLTVLDFENPIIRKECEGLWSVKTRLTKETIKELPALSLFCLGVMRLAAGLSKLPKGFEIPRMS
jgi:hypothetical protein